MLYKDLDMEEAKKRFDEITTSVPVEQPKEPMGEVRIGKEKRKRKVVKAILPKST